MKTWIKIKPYIVLFVVFLLLAAVELLATGCASLFPSLKQIMDPSVIYRRDMIVTVNGESFDGMRAVTLYDNNVIHVISPGNLDLFTVQNCAGETPKPKSWNVTTTERTGLFGWTKKTVDLPKEAEFTYTPSGLERNSTCPMILTGVSKDGVNSWGFIDWKVPEFTLKGTLTCNSVKQSFDGVEACQTRTGLWQKITFDEDVAVSPDPGCEIGKNVGKEFNFLAPARFCTYFIEGKTTKKMGRLTLLGYSGILVRN